MTDLTPEKRAELRELLAAATDGPWVQEWDTSDQWWTIHGQPNPAKGDERMVCPEVATLDHREDWTADVDLIVAAVNALPSLLEAAAERDWLQTVVGRLGRVNGEYAMEIHRCREALGVDEDTDPHHAAQALAAAVERVRELAEWHETESEKARRFRIEINGEIHVMDKAADVHYDAAARLRRALDGTDDGPTP